MTCGCPDSATTALPTNSKTHWTLESALSDVPKPVTAISSSPLAFFHVIERLKTTPREGWRSHGIYHGESVADHMYRMSIISMTCPDKSLNKDHCIKMALVHDMAEALVGDITPFDGIDKEEKHARELQSIEYICSKLLSPSSPETAAEIIALWREYEENKTPEAIFVHDVDKYELLCQAVEYEKKDETPKDLREFFHVFEMIRTPYVKKWANDALEERDAYWRGIVPNVKENPSLI